MSQANVEVVRRLYEALGRGDFRAAEAQLGPEVEWNTNARGSDGTVVFGPGGVMDGIRDWLDVWEDVSFEVRDVRDAGDRIAAHTRQHARGKGSGVRGDVDAYAIFTVADGVIAAYREYPTWPECLGAAGLEGQPVARDDVEG
jgi:ketosteroid isomerase-like protein